MLVDAGPLVALLDADEPDHHRCVAVANRTRKPLLTTWPVVAEAMHLLGSRDGWTSQEPLWRLILRGDLQLAELDDAVIVKAHELMSTYADLPMDLADATLVAVAETRKITRVFTLDSDFRVYRLPGRKRFTIVP